LEDNTEISFISMDYCDKSGDLKYYKDADVSISELRDYIDTFDKKENIDRIRMEYFLKIVESLKPTRLSKFRV